MAGKAVFKHTVLAAIWVAAGCKGGSGSHNIVGVWDIKGGPGTATMTFQADGNFKTEASMPGRSSSVFGQYTLSGATVAFSTPQQRTATVQWNSDNELVMTGDDGKAKTLDRRK